MPHESFLPQNLEKRVSREADELDSCIIEILGTDPPNQKLPDKGLQDRVPSSGAGGIRKRRR